MQISIVDYGPLLNPPKEPPAKAVVAIDVLSWVLPAAAAVLSVWGGLEALRGINDFAAVLAIAGGIASAFGVIFTVWSSRIRDGRLATVNAMGTFGMDIAEQVQARAPGGF